METGFRVYCYEWGTLRRVTDGPYPSLEEAESALESSRKYEMSHGWLSTCYRQFIITKHSTTRYNSSIIVEIVIWIGDKKEVIKL